MAEYDQQAPPPPQETEMNGNGNGDSHMRDSRDSRDDDRSAPRRPSHAPPNPEPTNVLGVFGLSIRTRERDIEDEFSRHGEVDKVVIVYDQRSERSRGFGFVTMKDVAGAEKCIAELNGMDLHGRRIRVDFSATKRAHNPTPGEYRGFKRDEYGSGGGGYGGKYGDRWASSSSRRGGDYYDRYGGGGGGYDRERYSRDRYDRYDDRDRGYRSSRDRDYDRDYDRDSYRRDRSRSPAPRRERRRSYSPRERSPDGREVIPNPPARREGAEPDYVPPPREGW
ncbi:RNA-binding domain-containing protein [Meredithblackwellia eburnea MCA 4105]